MFLSCERDNPKIRKSDSNRFEIENRSTSLDSSGIIHNEILDEIASNGYFGMTDSAMFSIVSEYYYQKTGLNLPDSLEYYSFPDDTSFEGIADRYEGIPEAEIVYLIRLDSILAHSTSVSSFYQNLNDFQDDVDNDTDTTISKLGLIGTASVLEYSTSYWANVANDTSHIMLDIYTDPPTPTELICWSCIPGSVWADAFAYADTYNNFYYGYQTTAEEADDKASAAAAYASAK